MAAARDSEHSDAVHELPKRKQTMPTVKVSNMLLMNKSHSMDPQHQRSGNHSPNSRSNMLRMPSNDRNKTVKFEGQDASKQGSSP